MMGIKELGLLVRKERKQRNLTQREFAHLFGYHQPWVSQLERGEIAISGELIHELAYFFNTDSKALHKIYSMQSTEHYKSTGEANSPAKSRLTKILAAADENSTARIEVPVKPQALDPLLGFAVGALLQQHVRIYLYTLELPQVHCVAPQTLAFLARLIEQEDIALENLQRNVSLYVPRFAAQPAQLQKVLAIKELLEDLTTAVPRAWMHLSHPVSTLLLMPGMFLLNPLEPRRLQDTFSDRYAERLMRAPKITQGILNTALSIVDSTQ